MIHTADYIIIVLYLAGVTAAGIIISGRQKSVRDYFLGGKTMRWWSVGFSIVASETSTLTFISIPGLSYISNMHFLQLVFGYFFGRLIVSLIFIPAYYRGELETAYDFLGKRFGLSLRKFTSIIFIITRVLASGVRLYATSIPVHIITGWEYPTCIFVIGFFTLMYTYAGGLKAVVAMDVVQLFIYLSGAALSMYIIVTGLPGGWDDVIKTAASSGTGKFDILNMMMPWDGADFFSSPYTLIGGLLGGTFLSMASHGTDQLLVQRLLGCRSMRDGQKALMLDAFIIVLQFLFFLVLGLCLFAYYNGASLSLLGLKSSDEIFPKFIIETLPVGISGFVIAGVLASAMGSLSSSISSLASSTFLDLFSLRRKKVDMDEKRGIFWSRLFTLIWGIVLIFGAMIFTGSRNPVVEIGLKIASITYGGLLGIFLLGLLFKKMESFDAFAGIVSSLIVMSGILFFTKIDYTWHTIIGCTVCIIAGNMSRAFRKSNVKSG